MSGIQLCTVVYKIHHVCKRHGKKKKTEKYSKSKKKGQVSDVAFISW